jgi:hypothetical protein
MNSDVSYMVAISRARNGLIVSWSRTAMYADAANNQIRIDAGSIFTDTTGDKRVKWSRSQLLPGSLPAPVAGAAWLKTFGL